MEETRQNSDNVLLAFILGGIAGSALTFLLSPKSGRELRGDIIDKIEYYQIQAAKRREGLVSEAKLKGEELLDKAEQLFQKIRNYAFGKYEFPTEKIEKEITSLKAALSATLKTYKHKNGNGKSNLDYTEDVFYEEHSRYDEFDDEALPKHLSMRRRNN